MLYWKEFNFDLKTPSQESGEVREGKVNNFSVMLGHSTLYWASMPFLPTDHKSPHHQESMLGFVENCIYCFQFIRYVLRFSYEIGKKQLRIFSGFVWIRPECRIHYDVQ